jgi:pSer/pThr/pTyr-binding forkhead associated (FHA) protein
MLRLVIEDDEGKTTIVPLIRDEITIGRKEGNTIRLTERNVSRHHARLVRTAASPPTILIEDLKSYNGVKLNGDRIADKATLKIGDLIQIGDYALALRDDAAEDQRPSAPARAATGIDAAPTAVHQVESLPESKCGKLVVNSSNIAGETYHLNRRELIVGRTDENDIVVNHRSISRNHAKIIFRDDSFTIIDLASSNGVKVNREPYGTASLVKGDIVELGQVKMRYVAPGDSYVFTPTDIDDSDMLPGPGIGRLVLIGMVLAAVAVGVFFLVDRSGTSNGDPVSATTTMGTAPTKADIDGWMAEAQSYVDQEEWDKAVAMYGKVLQAEPEHPEANSQRSRAQRESSAKRKFDRIVRNRKEKQWVDAYRELSEFPIKSRYYPMLEGLTGEIEAGYAEDELNRGLDLIEQKNRDAARRIYNELRKKQFAREQAEKLREALDGGAVAPSTEPAAPVTAVAVNPVTSAPRRPPSRSPATRRRVERAPATQAPKKPKVSFEQLLNDAQKETVKGNRRKAVELLRQALRQRPGSKKPHQQLCGVLPRLGRQSEALRHCRNWAARERNAAFQVRAREQVRRLEEALGQ